MRQDKARAFAFALDGLIRSRSKGHGGEEFARRCIDKIAEALTDPPTIEDAYAEHDSAVSSANERLQQRLGEMSA